MYGATNSLNSTSNQINIGNRNVMGNNALRSHSVRRNVWQTQTSYAVQSRCITEFEQIIAMG